MATEKTGNVFILCLLGALSVVSPFAIDMYLPAVPQMAIDFHTTSAVIALTISAYFIGLALGQVIYGPLLDRFGRKRPLDIGLSIFILASISCLFTRDVGTLIALRFLQALGGGIAQTGAVTMVHDFFPVEKSAKIFSMLFLFIGVSPLFAPSIGSFMTATVGWHWIFIMLAAVVAAILALIFFKLPEGHEPDPTISLHPRAIIAEYLLILKEPAFYTYALAGAFSFASLFTYVAGSPIIFMDGFHVSAETYGGIFALLAVGFLGGGQLNILLLKYFTSEKLFAFVVTLQVAIGLVFLLGELLGGWGLAATLLLFFPFLACAGIGYPNAAALALARFSRNAGSASALLGFLQFGVGAFISTGIGAFGSHGSLPVIGIMALTAIIGLLLLFIGKKKIVPGSIVPGEETPIRIMH